MLRVFIYFVFLKFIAFKVILNQNLSSIHNFNYPNTKEECLKKIKHYSNLGYSSDNPLFYSGSNLNELGNYERCFQNSTLNYFLLKIKFDLDKKSYLTGYLGLCLPGECEKDESKEIIISYIQNFTTIIKEDNLNIYFPEEYNKKITTPGISNYIIIGLFGIYFIIASGLIQFLILKIKFSNRNKNDSEGNTYNEINTIPNIAINSSGNSTFIFPSIDDASLIEPSLLVENKDKDKELNEYTINNYLYQILETLNFLNNWKKFFSLNSNQDLDKELKFINTIRVILCFFIILLHTMVFVLDTPVKGVETFITNAKSLPMQFIVQGHFIVDVFFTFTGFFVSYVGLKKISSTTSGTKFFFNSFVFRFFRVWPLLIASFLFFWKVIYLFGEGPVYGLIMNKELSSCDKQWPWILLLINNWTYGIYEKEVPVCFGWLWYIANDFQMSILGFFLIILYKKRYKVFLPVFILILAATIYFEVNSLLNAHYGMNFLKQGGILSNFVDYYIKFYNRCSPFFIGLLFGIVYYEFKVNKKFNVLQNIKNNNLVLVSMFLFGWLLILVMILIPYFSYDVEVSNYIAFSYNFLSRKIVALGLVLACLSLMLGSFKRLREMMPNVFFTYISKLGFALYVIHPSIIKFVFYSSVFAKNMKLSYLFLYGSGFIIITLIVSLLFHILFEMPFCNIKKLCACSQEKQRI